jgi:hypothetical protein
MDGQLFLSYSLGTDYQKKDPKIIYKYILKDRHAYKLLMGRFSTSLPVIRSWTGLPVSY